MRWNVATYAAGVASWVLPANPTQGSLDAFYRDRAITNGAWGAAILGVAAAIVLWATR
jgi:hypothetical protein